MSSSSKPSIFTSREAFQTRAIEPSTSAGRTASPSRRQSTPNYIEKNRIEAAAEAAPLVTTSAHTNLANTVGKGVEKELSDNRDSFAQLPLWASPPLGEKDGYSRSQFDRARGRSASVSAAATGTPPVEYPPTLKPSKKRPAGTPYEERGPTSEPSKKRPKVDVKQRRKHRLDGFSLGVTGFQTRSSTTFSSIL